MFRSALAALLASFFAVALTTFNFSISSQSSASHDGLLSRIHTPSRQTQDKGSKLFEADNTSHKRLRAEGPPQLKLGSIQSADNLPSKSSHWRNRHGRCRCLCSARGLAPQHIRVIAQTGSPRHDLAKLLLRRRRSTEQRRLLQAQSLWCETTPSAWKACCQDLGMTSCIVWHMTSNHATVFTSPPATSALRRCQFWRRACLKALNTCVSQGCSHGVILAGTYTSVTPLCLTRRQIEACMCTLAQSTTRTTWRLRS